MLKKAVILLVLLAAGCTQSFYSQGRKHVDEGRYDQAIDYLYKEIQTNPESYEAWRELGIAFYNKGDLIKAEDALKQANNIQPDARTNVYMGLIFEQKRQYDKAIGAYSASLSMKTEGKTRAMIKAYLDRLISRKIKDDASLAVENEASIDVASIPGNTIAVVDFDGSQLPPELAPISKGLAEFTSVDLSKVSGLSVVDRLKIEAILGELKLSSSKRADPAYAPRVGRLLGSRRIVSGYLTEAGDENLRLDGGIINTVDSTTELTGSSTEKLQGIFKLQKDFVFKVIDSLGVELTLEERDAIKEVPTESFLAFMSYCRGLDYQSLGMTDAARLEFENAVSEDKSFQQASAKLNEVTLAPSVDVEEIATFESFESSVTAESDKELEYTGLDVIHSTTLDNTGFISERRIYDRYGNSPIRPPNPDEAGYGIIIIRGNLDVD